jgi:hypothetical protein
MNSEKWFSWFWLIFWIIACLPIAIVDILIKLGDKNENMNNSGIV